MISDGMAEVLRSLRPGEVGDPARACAQALRAEGVVLSLPAGPDPTAEPVWCHSELSARFEELQFTLGEGPGPDAVRSGSPVVEPDLGRVRAGRWPALLPAARELGVHGVCCFPLVIGAIRVGTLTMLSESDRRLSAQQYTDATALTSVPTSGFLDGGTRGFPGSACPWSWRRGRGRLRHRGHPGTGTGSERGPARLTAVTSPAPPSRCRCR
ncbi:GAF domain-containing protein [Streptomyces fulvoviolaceus]|uniref:GAF domain-containing protein n=1 Tax=Streptomyces fulvoviolaceus TaxID=285535 RepID=UPI000ADE5122|nr:hypothetical protein [Streptomyces fulvoviolaceus]